MRILRKLLIGLGGMFAIIILSFVWMGVSGQRFKNSEIPFITQFVTGMS